MVRGPLRAVRLLKVQPVLVGATVRRPARLRGVVHCPLDGLLPHELRQQGDAFTLQPSPYSGYQLLQRLTVLIRHRVQISVYDLIQVHHTPHECTLCKTHAEDFGKRRRDFVSHSYAAVSLRERLLMCKQFYDNYFRFMKHKLLLNAAGKQSPEQSILTLTSQRPSGV